MSGSSLRVMVADVGADVVLLMLDGAPVLVLRPEQSFESAVTQVCEVCPELHPDAARRLVREHLPHALEMSVVDDFVLQATPPPEPPPLRSGRGRRGLQVTGVAASALLVAGAGLAVVVSDQLESSEPLPSVLASGAFDSAQFDAWSSTGTMMCTATAALTAHCTDEDGLVMTSEAAVGPTSVLYTFSYGRERLALRIFSTAGQAEAFAAESAAPPPNLRVVNRFVMWGSDADRIGEYAESILQANSGGDVLRATQGASYVLSARLGRLVAGTATAERQPPVDERTMVALENVVAGKETSEPVTTAAPVPTVPRQATPTTAPSTASRRATPPSEVVTMEPAQSVTMVPQSSPPPTSTPPTADPTQAATASPTASAPTVPAPTGAGFTAAPSSTASETASAPSSTAPSPFTT